MMSPEEREAALTAMQQASDRFYGAAIQIGNHPFIEFAGLMNEYIKACAEAHRDGVDFSECNTHSGKALPMPPYMIAYVNEKLECIYTGRCVMRGSDVTDADVDAFLKAIGDEEEDPARIERIRQLFKQKAGWTP